jgi:hypothetical protein
LAEIESLMATIADDNSDLALAASTHIELLNAAERSEDAIVCGQRHLQRLRAVHAPEYRLELMLSQACAAKADHEQAERYLQDVLEQRNVTGLIRGVAYEIAARVALARGDGDVATTRLARCDAHLRIGKHPALTARCKALRRAASRAAHSDASDGTLIESTPAASDSTATESQTKSDDAERG